MKINLIVLVCLLVLSCNRQKVKKVSLLNKTECETLNVGKKDIRKHIELTDSFNVDFIRLETNKECLIGSVDKAILYNKNLFIMDSRDSKQIFVFTDTGKYLYKIGRCGRGPKEYLFLNDMVIYNNKLYVYVVPTKKIIVYGLDGHYIDEIKLLNYSGINMEILKKDGTIVTCGGLGEMFLRCFNQNGKVISQNLRLPKSKIHEVCNKPFTEHKGTLYYIPAFGDSIYVVTSDGIYPRYFLKMVNPYPSEKVKIDNDLKRIKNKYDYDKISEISISDGYLFYHYSFLSKGFFGLTNLKTKNTVFSPIFLVYGLHIQICGDTENGPIFTQLASSVEWAMKNLPFLKFHPDMKEVKKDDNPVLFIVRGKKHEKE